MARLGPSGLAQLFREIANYVSTRLSNYNTKAELDTLLDTKANDDNVVHTTGDETIEGVKTFTGSPFVSNYAVTNGYFTKINLIARNEVPTQIHHSAFRVFDKNAKTLGEYCVEKSTSGSSLLHMDVHTEDSEGNDIMESVYLNLSNDGSSVSFHPAKNNRTDLGMPHYKWAKIYSDDVVHTSGDETIEGNKYFTQDVNVKNSDVDIAVTPSSNLFSCFRFRGKSNVTTASIQYSQRTYGVNDICFYVWDADSNSHGFRIRTDNRLEPIESNTYSLGSSSSKWADAYIGTTYSDKVTCARFTHSVNNGSVYITGGSEYDKGATLVLHGEESSDAGAFIINSRDTTNSLYLVGKPDGTLQWAGQNIALDGNVVHISGNDTIEGTKTFASGPWVTNNHNTTGYSIKNTALARNDVPSEYQHYTFRAYDKNNNISGEYCIEKATTGDALLNMNVRSEDSEGTQIVYGMQFRMTNDGSLVRFMPSANNKVHLGDVGAKWSSVHATNAHITNTYTNRVTTYSITHPSGDNDSYFFMSGGSEWDKGANLFLYGSSVEGYTGYFEVVARDSTQTSTLRGTPDGYLTWKGQTIATDNNVVHTSGREVIGGDKVFQNTIYRESDITTSTVAEVYRFVDTNATPCGSIYNRMHWYNNNIYNRHQAYNATSDKDMYVEVLSGNDGSGVINTGGSVTNNKNLTTVTNATGNSYVATMGWVNNPETSTNVVHRSGNETINGVKSFNNLMYIYNNMSNKNSQMDLFTTPTNTLFSHYMFVDKNDEISAYMQYGQGNTGTDFIGLFIHDKNRALHGLQVTTNNEVIPISHMTYSLGSASRVWNNAYISRIYCANIVSPVENSYIYMTAGPSWNNGASIFLNGKSGDGNGSGNGTFTLYARDGTTERYLLGRPDGILNWTGCIESHEVRATTVNAFMAQYGSYTFLIRNDGSNTYFLMSEKDGTPGTWSSARPLTINNSTGTCSINGNANTATYSTTQASSDNSTKIATTAYVKSQGYVKLTSLAGGNSAGSLNHSVGSLVLAYCSSTAFSGTKSYANVAGQQLYPCRTEIYTMYASSYFTPVVVRYAYSSLGSGTWRYLGGSAANFNNASGEVYGMFLRVA